MTEVIETHTETREPQHGDEMFVSLNRLKASPRNARRMPHTEAAIQALAASIAAKGVLQAPRVEPERNESGALTGAYLVTIGEGRRLALRLLAKRKAIKKTEPVKVVIDTLNDAHEISLDENVTRSDMHPADQFEAFRRLSEERGLGAEAIGARFGVSAHVVRQRLRLGAVSPKLMALYRADELNLDQLMAFAVSEDHARQEQVLEQLSWNRSAHLIRRAMTELKVAAHDKRAVYVGAEAYGEAGGTILRDLFTEDGGGWFEDVALLDRLASAALGAEADRIRTAEGWKWAEAHLDYPHTAGFSRIYPHALARSAEETAAMTSLAEEYDALISQWDAIDDLPPEVDARFKAIDAALEAYGESFAYEPNGMKRAGVFVVLGHDGQVRIERGLVHPEDIEAPAILETTDKAEGEALILDDPEAEPVEPVGEPGAPLPERLVLDLTAHRTMALRDALGTAPGLALTAVTHSLALFAFYPAYVQASCLALKGMSAYLEGFAGGIADSPAGRAVAARHEAWAKRLPQEPGDLWPVVEALSPEEVLALLAHCAALTVNAVHNPIDRRPMAWAQADALAETLSLDMSRYWSPTVDAFFGRITKAQITDAVGEAVSADVAERLSGLKKPDMAAAAAEAVAGTGWLPLLLRRSGAKAVAEARADAADDATLSATA